MSDGFIHLRSIGWEVVGCVWPSCRQSWQVVVTREPDWVTCEVCRRTLDWEFAKADKRADAIK